METLEVAFYFVALYLITVVCISISNFLAGKLIHLVSRFFGMLFGVRIIIHSIFKGTFFFLTIALAALIFADYFIPNQIVTKVGSDRFIMRGDGISSEPIVTWFENIEIKEPHFYFRDTSNNGHKYSITCNLRINKGKFNKKIHIERIDLSVRSFEGKVLATIPSIQSFDFSTYNPNVIMVKPYDIILPNKENGVVLVAIGNLNKNKTISSKPIEVSSEIEQY